jgi:hypothetical protein
MRIGMISSGGPDTFSGNFVDGSQCVGLVVAQHGPKGGGFRRPRGAIARSATAVAIPEQLS